MRLTFISLSRSVSVCDIKSLSCLKSSGISSGSSTIVASSSVVSAMTKYQYI